MSDIVTVHGLGAAVDIELGDGPDPGDVSRAWSRCLAGPDTQNGYTKSQGLVSAEHMSMTGLTQTITRELIRLQRGELLMLHAGAVSHPVTGAAVAYAAPGGTGKTTLTRLLGRRFGYISDETVGIEPGTWRIHPYPKPLSVRTSDTSAPKDEMSPDALALLRAHPRPHLAGLLILRRDPALAEPVWTRLDVLDGIMALAPETSSLSRLPRPLQVLDALYAAVGGFWLVEYAQAEEIAGRVSTLIDGSL